MQFVLEGAERNDKRIDSRGGFISKLASRLSQIKVFYSGALVRTYDFTYVPNEFGQSLLSSYSETNGGGTEPFYTYSFDYYSLPRHPDQTGYDAFGEEEQFPVGGSIPFKGLNSTVSTAIGGDLYLGLEIFIWLPFWGKETIANFGVRGGLQFTSERDSRPAYRCQRRRAG